MNKVGPTTLKKRRPIFVGNYEQYRVYTELDLPTKAAEALSTIRAYLSKSENTLKNLSGIINPCHEDGTCDDLVITADGSVYVIIVPWDDADTLTINKVCIRQVGERFLIIWSELLEDIPLPGYYLRRRYGKVVDTESRKLFADLRHPRSFTKINNRITRYNTLLEPKQRIVAWVRD